MILYPAIDLKDGECVRLRQGRMDEVTSFNVNPAEQAQKFVAAGCQWLHLVDLNGAFAGEPINREAVFNIIRSLRSVAPTEQGDAARAVGVRGKIPPSEINIQLGGGIRNLDTIGMWLALGIQRVILGTVAVKNPQLVKDACKQFPGKIAVGIDTKDGMAAIDGWAEASEITALELAKRFEDAGVSAIIYTDIARDGEMMGPNLEATVALADAVSIPVIVSGGVSSLDDLRRIRKHSKLNGAIIGRALYEGMDVVAARAILES